MSEEFVKMILEQVSKTIGTLAEVTTRVKSIEDTVKDINDDVGDLRRDVKGVEGELSKLRQDVKDVNTKMTELGRDVSDMRRNLGSHVSEALKTAEKALGERKEEIGLVFKILLAIAAIIASLAGVPNLIEIVKLLLK